jgi:hypothetical protein
VRKYPGPTKLSERWTPRRPATGHPVKLYQNARLPLLLHMEFDERQRKPEIWDTFREEHFEGRLSRSSNAYSTCLNTSLLVLEQLPLSIHRQLILLRELDQQLRRSLPAHTFTFSIPILTIYCNDPGQNAGLWTTTRQYLSSRIPSPSDTTTRNVLPIPFTISTAPHTSPPRTFSNAYLDYQRKSQGLQKRKSISRRQLSTP